MATNFELKLAITRLIWEISPGSLRLTGGFGVGLLNNVSEILPRPTLVAMATKCGSKLVVTQLVWEICPRFLHPPGGFRGRAIERWHSTTATDPGCHGNEIWAKMDYNSTYMRDISKFLPSNRGFSGSGYWTMSVKFFRDRPRLPW